MFGINSREFFTAETLNICIKYRYPSTCATFGTSLTQRNATDKYKTGDRKEFVGLFAAPQRYA